MFLALSVALPGLNVLVRKSTPSYRTHLATPIEHIRSLDGIRGLAAISMVLFNLLL